MSLTRVSGVEGRPAVRTRGLHKIYGRGPTACEALRGVDFDVFAGEFVILSGPSGSGKTTLLSIVGCVLSPTSGIFELMGEDLSRARERDLPHFRLKYIGFVFQSHNLIASLTARDNITLPLRMRGYSTPAAHVEAERLLSDVRLSDKADRLPRDLSIGQCQRVAIARALAGLPPLILADEPTAALDAQNGVLITELLRNLAKEHGHSVVVVTHDSRIFHLADRVVSVEDGRIVSDAERAP